MICPKCGKWQADETSFCSNCGTPLTPEKAREEAAEARKTQEPEPAAVERPNEGEEATEPLPTEEVAQRLRANLAEGDALEAEILPEEPADSDPTTLQPAPSDPVEADLRPAPDDRAKEPQIHHPVRQYVPDRDFYGGLPAEQSPQGGSWPQPPAPPRSHWRGLSAYQIMLFVGLILLILLVFFSQRLLAPRFQPEAVAEHFFVALANNKPKEALRLMDRKGASVPIEEQSLAALQSYFGLGEATSFSVRHENFLVSAVTGNQGPLRRKVTIEYLKEGSEEVHKLPLTLERKNTPDFFFFDRWRVRPESLSVPHFEIRLPEKLTVWVDDHLLGTALFDREQAKRGEDVYQVPSLLFGVHKIRIAGAGHVPLEANVLVSEKTPRFQCPPLPLTKESIQALNQTALANCKRILQMAAQKQAFEKITGLFVTDEDVQKEAQAQYEALTRRLDQYKSLEIKGLEAQALPEHSEVKVRIRFHQSKKQQSFWSRIQNVFSSDEKTVKISFRLEEGVWKQTSWDKALPWD